jgi:hypothetical protein
MDIVILARLLIPVFTLVIGIVCQYLMFYESGVNFFAVVSKMFVLWVLYLFLGVLFSEHFLRLMKKRGGN